MTCFGGKSESFLHLLFPKFLQLDVVTVPRGHGCDGVSWARQALTYDIPS